jgi:signal peptidase
MTRVERASRFGRQRRVPDGGADAGTGGGAAGTRVVLGAARAVAALVLAALAGLVVVALAPQALGYSAHVVTSGSMAPRVHPGDVVLTQPTTAAELRPGQVLLFDDPQRPGGLLLHRLVSFDAAGDLVTRGDANQSADSVHASPSAVRGVARIRVPWVGLPAVWRGEGRIGAIALAAAVLGGAAVFVSQAFPRRRAGTGAGSRPARASGSSATPGSPMTGTGRATAVHADGRDAVQATARATTSAAEERRRCAASTGYALPPVPPALPRPGGHRGGPAGAADRRHRPSGEHSGCYDGGRYCGQPRR